MFKCAKSFSFWGDFVPQIPYRGFAPGPTVGLPSPNLMIGQCLL